MSGNFTQRGECAVYDKYARAEAAVRCGADLVLELPFPWSSAGAEFFALGGVSVAAGAGISAFIYGSEDGDISAAENVSMARATDEYRSLLDLADGENVGAAAAHAGAMKEIGLEPGRNDKLASFYMDAARKIGLSASFTAVKRVAEDAERPVGSSDLRKMMRSGDREKAESFIVPDALRAYKKEGVLRGNVPKLDEILFTYFRLFAPERADGVFDAGGGVFERLRRAAKNARSGEEFFSLAANKKYTNARLRRAALYSVLGVTGSDVASKPEFTYLLALNGRGRSILNGIGGALRVLTKPSDASSLTGTAARQYELSRRADDLFAACCDPSVPSGEFLRRSPYIEKNG